MRRILFAVFILCCLPTAAFAARAPVPGDTCGGGGANANGFPMGVTNAWTMTGPAADGGIVNGMFCNGSTWTGVINYQSTGNVGIGTTTPDATLNVVGTATSNIVDFSNSGVSRFYIDLYGNIHLQNGVYFGYDNNRAQVAWTTIGTDLYITTDGSTGSNNSIFLYPYGTGKVGIGTTTPAAKLDVAGEIRTTGNTLACSSTTTGAIRYNSSSRAFDYCGGSTPAWTAFSASSSAAGSSGQVQFNSGGALAGASGLVYTSAGNVGIGTTSPATQLHLYNSGSLALGRIEDNNNSVGATASLQIISDYSLYDNLAFYGTSSAWQIGEAGYSNFTIRDITNNRNPFNIEQGALADSVHINSSGYVGIDNASPTVALDVIGDIHYSGTLTDVSDRRMKHDIRPLPDQLAKLERLQPVSYVKNADPKFRTDYGFIAQDVQPIYPDLVETDPTGLRSMNYTGLISPMVAGMQEQQDEIRALWVMLAFSACAAIAACVACFVLWRSSQRMEASLRVHPAKAPAGP